MNTPVSMIDENNSAEGFRDCVMAAFNEGDKDMVFELCRKENERREELNSIDFDDCAGGACKL